MSTIIVVTGLQGSGKSTFAKAWVAEAPADRVRINYDELRSELYGPDWRWNRNQEDKMKFEAHLRAEQAIKDGRDVIIDNTNLTRAARKPWMNIAKTFKAEYSEVEMGTPVSECVARDRVRTARVGRALIERNALFYGYIDWSDLEVYPRNFVLVDMDGTVADCDWRRKLALEGPTVHKPSISGAEGTDIIPCSLDGKVMDRQCPSCGGKAKKNWKLFLSDVQNDPPITPIIDLVDHLNESYDIIVVSGRPMDACGMGTENWLEQYFWLSRGIETRHLFMRNRNDFRDDVQVKREILELLPRDRIKWVLDDRPAVLRMWQQNGLTTLAVGPLQEF